MGTASLVIRGIVFLIGVPFLLVGLFFLLIAGGVTYSEYQDTQGIASTQGTIQSSSLEEATVTEDGTTQTVYYPRVQYSYEVDGQTRQGDGVYAPTERSSTSELEGKEFEDITRAQEAVREYRAGQTVTVYYYQDDPGEPFLEKPTVNWAGGLVTGLFFAGIPLAIGVTLSGGALFFGRIRSWLGGRTKSAEPAVDADGEYHEDDDWDDDDGGGGGWGGGWDGGGDGGGGGGE